jgi:hypothetical protein
MNDKKYKYKLLASVTAMVFGGVVLASGIASAQESDESGVEVQTRGPVHEAFAGAVSFNPEVGIIINQPPPELIEEIPPEQRPEGDNVSWIPGYWAWDEEPGGFLWISGIWRNLPPGREWIPGYWAEIDEGHQWTSGYWEDVENTEISYLPEPPRSLEVGPNIEAASNDQSWVPGNWVYRDDRYAWRGGYWAQSRPNWSWTPAYYRWTPRGHVYVDGYWDYPVARRGVVFAPVRFNASYRSRPNYHYTPSTVISLSVFANHLFLRPNYGHYYFGDYYEPRYRDRGFYASYSYHSSRYGYDPIYSHYRWENRKDRNWERGRRDYFEYRRDHQNARPPRTWAMLNARAQGDRNRDFEVAERYDTVVANRDGGQQFQAVDKKDRERYISQRQEIRKFGKERQELETRGKKSGSNAGKDRDSVSKEKIKRSPVMAEKSGRSEKDGGPPERLQPRSSDKDRNIATTKNADKDENKPRRDKDKVDGSGGSESKNKNAADTERRVKPGEKRQANPNPERGGKSDGKRQADPNADGKKKPGEKRQADPNPERQADPKSERKSNPDVKRQANPNAEVGTKPGEKRQANPKSEERTKPGEKRQANPNPERRANPTPKRQAEPAPERKANPKGEVQTERKPKKADDQAASAKQKAEQARSRAVEAQRAGQETSKKAQPERRAGQRPQPIPQKETAKQNRSKEAAKPADETSETEEEKKK